MLKRLAIVKLATPFAVAALLGGAALSLNGPAAVSAQAEPMVAESVQFVSAPEVLGAENSEIRDAVALFVRGMSDGDAQAVWIFASEEDQAAFGTETAVLAAFAETFPVLTQADQVAFKSFRTEGDTPFVELALTDDLGDAYRASIGLWLDDAGDWKVISLDIEPTEARVASL